MQPEQATEEVIYQTWRLNPDGTRTLIDETARTYCFMYIIRIKRIRNSGTNARDETQLRFLV